MNLFRIRGIQVAVHASFFLLLAFAAQEGWQEDRWPGLALESGMLIAFFTCVVLHELGHSFTAMRFGIGVRRILLMPIGGMAEMDDIPRQPSRELLITLAGPAVNFVIAAVLWLILRTVNYADDADPNYSWPAFTTELVIWNIRMGIFNLLPAFPMDGGRILRALLATRMRYLRATFWAATIGKVIAVLGALFAIFVLSNWLLVLLFAFIFYAGEMEYRAVRRRELEDAHWRAVLARAYATSVPPPAEEPPVLTR
jgi:Zn-dependent protease